MRLLFVAALFVVLAPLLAAPTTAQFFPGVSDARYVSPRFGYALSWDDTWRLDRSISRPGFDGLVLSNGVSDVVLTATTGFAGTTGFIATPEQCVQQSLAALVRRPGTQPVPLQDEAGMPRQGSEPDLFWMEVGFAAADGAPMNAYVSCRGLGLSNGAMQTFIHLAPALDYDAEVLTVDALLDGYEAPRLDLDQLDQGAGPIPAP